MWGCRNFWKSLLTQKFKVVLRVGGIVGNMGEIKLLIKKF